MVRPSGKTASFSGCYSNVSAGPAAYVKESLTKDAQVLLPSGNPALLLCKAER